MKRVFDMLGALVGLVVLSPLLLLLWIAVVVESGLPGLFRQRRVGRFGRDFVLLKFRSMTQGGRTADGRRQTADQRGQETGDRRQGAGGQQPIANGNVDGGSFEAGNASRVTRVGRFLRKTKLDELPQLWNVLKGDMALVGPRPEVRKWVEVYPERWAKVLTIRPGITDPASIEFRNEEELLANSPDPERMYRDEILPRKLALYEQYVATRSFRGDMEILVKTVWAVVGR